MNVQLFVATKIFIEYQGKILIIRESSKYEDGTKEAQYDVIGGRITPGEKFDDAMRREVKEETGLEVALGEPFFVNESWPTVRGEQWQIIRIFYTTQTNTDQVTLSDDHDAYLWIDPKNYRKEEYQVIDNLFPVFEEYLKRYV